MNDRVEPTVKLNLNNYMHLIVDCREHKIIREINNTVEYDIKQLDIGDFHISDNDKLLCVIERKTISDLESSIVDGRYKEQKARMMASGFPFFYIIEYSGILQRSFGAIINTQVRDRIPMIYSSGVTDTVKILSHLLKKEISFFSNNNEHIFKNYSAVHIKKSKNMSASDIFVSQLAVIPGVSRRIGNIIKQYYPSMTLIVLAFNDHHEPERMLTKIPTIGILLSKRIFEQLCSST